MTEKRWFFHCDYIKHIHQIRLYTIPYPLTAFEYHFNRENLSLSTWNQSAGLTMIFDRIKSLTINFNQIKEQIVKGKSILFRHVTELYIRLDEFWSTKSIHFLSALVDLSYIRRFVIQLHYDQLSIFNLVAHFPRLKSLDLVPLDADDASHQMKMEKITLSIPMHVKHVTLKIQSLDEMKLVFNTLPHISSIMFNYPYHRKINSKEIIQWLQENRRTFTFFETDHSLNIWLNKNSLCL